MLIADAGCCCWSLLLIAVAGCCCWLLLLVAAAGCCCWLLLLIAWKVFEYFRDIGDLRLRQFCRRKSLWRFSGCCWKVFHYFQVVDEKSSNISRILMRRRWKRVSPRGSGVVDGRKGMNNMAVHWVFILVWSRAEREPIGSFGEKLRASRSALQNLRLRQVLKLS